MCEVIWVETLGPNGREMIPVPARDEVPYETTTATTEVVEETPVEEPVVEEAPVEEPAVKEAPVEEPVVEEAPKKRTRKKKTAE